MVNISVLHSTFGTYPAFGVRVCTAEVEKPEVQVSGVRKCSHDKNNFKSNLILWILLSLEFGPENFILLSCEFIFSHFQWKRQP